MFQLIAKGSEKVIKTGSLKSIFRAIRYLVEDRGFSVSNFRVKRAE